MGNSVEEIVEPSMKAQNMYICIYIGLKVLCNVEGRIIHPYPFCDKSCIAVIRYIRNPFQFVDP